MSERIFKHVKVIAGQYINRIGIADFTFTAKTHNVVFILLAVIHIAFV